MPATDLDLLTVAEAATLLRISAPAVRALIKAGALPHYRPSLGGRSVRISRAAVERHVARSRVDGDAGEGGEGGEGLKWVTLR